jgi:uncharacterized protein
LILVSVSTNTMSANKQTVEAYMTAYGKLDHPAVLACLTDDVEWLIPGMFHVTGKAAFDKEIECDTFVGPPHITTTRLTEEGNVVIAEGRVVCTRKDGIAMNVAFCDVFEMRDAKIRKLISYLMEVKTPV